MLLFSSSQVSVASALSGLQLASHAPLDAAQRVGRRKCSRCGASRMFYCYSCCALVGCVNPQRRDATR
uniref:Uncharacterized protein n=1 Tax=Sinocyclocheilus grahami TaxID=75366 RepID=A0A672KA62_SINGR